jgi:KaiC/GvpD/RAD55 family RecA-like ATPase
MKNLAVILVLVCFLVFFNGCAKRVLLNYDDVKLNSLVQIKTIKGNFCQGIVQKKDSSFLVMQLDKYNDKLTKIERDKIATIAGQQNYALDAQNQVISEWEIDQIKESNNLLLYSIGGAGLSFGASFFVGSLLNRSLNDVDLGRTVMWATTAVGTVVGTTFFAKAGAKRDRFVAVEKIREQRVELAKQQVEQERLKRLKIQEELQKVKEERKRQDEEISKLKEQTKQK